MKARVIWLSFLSFRKSSMDEETAANFSSCPSDIMVVKVYREPERSTLRLRRSLSALAGLVQASIARGIIQIQIEAENMAAVFFRCGYIFLRKFSIL